MPTAGRWPWRGVASMSATSAGYSGEHRRRLNRGRIFAGHCDGHATTGCTRPVDASVLPCAPDRRTSRDGRNRAPALCGSPCPLTVAGESFYVDVRGANVGQPTSFRARRCSGSWWIETKGRSCASSMRETRRHSFSVRTGRSSLELAHCDRTQAGNGAIRGHNYARTMANQRRVYGGTLLVTWDRPYSTAPTA